MKTPEVLTIPNPILRQSMPQITTFDNSLAELAATMIKSMHKSNGVGLAANQIGYYGQIFVYGVEPFEHEGQKYPAIPPRAVINPTIKVIDETLEIMEEGCLSIPNLWGPVARPRGVQLSAQDINGNSFVSEIFGYEARIVQHETDHLNGKLFLDYITDPTKLRSTE